MQTIFLLVDLNEARFPLFGDLLHLVMTFFSLSLVFQEKVRLRYKLTFNLGDKSHDESGDVDQFPSPNTWGNL